MASGAPVQIGWTRGSERVQCEDHLVKMYPGEGRHWASIWEGNPSAQGTRHVGLNCR